VIGLIGLKGKIVTADAPLYNRRMVEAIIEKGGDYCIALRGQPGLLALRCACLPCESGRPESEEEIPWPRPRTASTAAAKRAPPLSAQSGLYRLEQLVQEAVVTVPRNLIVQAIDIVVFLEGRGLNRRVETVLELASLDETGDYLLKPLGQPTLHIV